MREYKKPATKPKVKVYKGWAVMIAERPQWLAKDHPHLKVFKKSELLPATLTVEVKG